MGYDSYIESTVRSRGNGGSGLDITQLTGRRPLINKAEVIISGTQPFEIGLRVPLSKDIVSTKENTLFLPKKLDNNIQKHLQIKHPVTISLIENGNAVFVEPSLSGRKSKQIETNLERENIKKKPAVN